MIEDFKQYDPRWNRIPFAGENINNAGCGPTSMADVLAALKDIIPPEVASWLDRHGWTVSGAGTVWAGIPAGLRAFGANGAQLVYDSQLGKTDSKVFDRFRAHLASGYCGIMLMGNGGSPVEWTKSGHYIAAVGCHADGRILIYDPASRDRTGWHFWSDFIPSIKILYLTDISSLTPPVDAAYKFESGWMHAAQDGFAMSEGPRVTLLQKVWRAYGWYKGVIDGKYEDGTKAACILGQKLNNLEQDGSAGYDTQRATFRLRSERKDGKYIFYCQKAEKGSQGESVILAQCILKTDGIYFGAIDGDFGGLTDEAVRKFQSARGLKVDGQVAGETWKALIGF